MNTPGVHIVGFGQCSLDFIGQVDRYPELDQKAELDGLLTQGGGPVATALVTLARLGVATYYVGRVGDDNYGRQIRLGLEGEGVDCGCLLTDPGQSSQVAFIAVDPEGHRNIFWTRGSAQPVSAGELPLSLIRGASLLHLDGLHLDASLAAARTAREAGVVTVLDGGTLREGTERLLPLIDHLVVSEKFARQLAGSDLDQTLQMLGRWGAEAVTVTLGKKGSITRAADGEPFTQPAFPMEVVDTTGCGDVFHGGYIYGLLQGWDLREVIRFATACAGLKTRALGGRTAIPGLEEVLDFLKDNAAT